MTLEEAIKHCEEVAEEQEDFDKFQCGYWKPGCEDGVWKHTCRLPSNIPVGSSWGECSEQNCPLFHECLECAKEHRQLAEWLRELQRYRFEISECKAILDNPTPDVTENDKKRAMYVLQTFPDVRGDEI